MSEHLPLEARLFIFYKTNQLVTQYFAHWQDSDVSSQDWDHRVKAYMSRIVQTEDRIGFCLLMMEYLAPLRNGHTNYFDWQVFQQVKGLGIDLGYVDEEWVATQSLFEGVVPGDVTTSRTNLWANGLPEQASM